MRRANITFALAVIILICCGLSSEHADGVISTVSCRSVDGFAADLRSYVLEVATGTDSLSAETRAAWNIPAISDSTQIVFVSDST